MKRGQFGTAVKRGQFGTKSVKGTIWHRNEKRTISIIKSDRGGTNITIKIVWGSCLCALRALGWRSISLSFDKVFLSHLTMYFSHYGAKLSLLHSWCQIVPFTLRCQIVLVPNRPILHSWCQIVLGAKLSSFTLRCQIVPPTWAVPNCPRCQIVLGAKLS